MGRWAERHKNGQLSLGVRQHMATLEVARQIEGQMQSAGIKRSQLAERLGKSRAWISKLLHGGQNVTVFTLVEVADALGFDLDVKLRPRLVQVVQGTSTESVSGASQGNSVVWTRVSEPIPDRQAPQLHDKLTLSEAA